MTTFSDDQSQNSARVTDGQSFVLQHNDATRMANGGAVIQSVLQKYFTNTGKILLQLSSPLQPVCYYVVDCTEAELWE